MSLRNLNALGQQVDGAQAAERGAFLPADEVADVVADEVDGAVGLKQRFVSGVGVLAVQRMAKCTEWRPHALVAANVPNTCRAVTIDTGDPDNLHPKDKEPVGDRLARCALALHYGEKIAYEGPTLASVDRLPGAIKLHFAHADGGLVSKGPKLGEFSIAGDDRKWYWADAKVEGDTVVLSSASVAHPMQVRYAWQGNPQATLFNGAGLPAGPFRTDTWPRITESHRPH